MMMQLVRYVAVLVFCFTATNATAGSIESVIDAYYHCGMSHYIPYSGAYISIGDEEKAALYLLEHSCAKEYEALKDSLTSYEKERSKLPKGEKDEMARLGLPEFSVTTTLEGHQKYARDEIRYLFRVDRLTDCWIANAGKYVRGTKESAETILDASLLDCRDEQAQLKEIVAAIYFDKADEKQTQSIQIAKQRVNKYILDERLKQGTPPPS